MISLHELNHLIFLYGEGLTEAEAWQAFRRMYPYPASDLELLEDAFYRFKENY